MKTNYGRYGAIAVLATAAYINTLHGDFVFDDSEAIVKNRDVMPSTPLSQVFKDDFWGTEIALNLSHKSYRPLTIISYRLNVYTSGNQLVPLHFHATNIFLFVVFALLTYYALQLFIHKHSAQVATTLFVVHPVHTEVVASLVGRADLLCSIAFVLSLIVYHRMITRSTSSNVQTFILFTLNFVLVFAGVLCKETAITALGMCFLLEVNHLRHSRHSTHWRSSFLRCFALICLCALIFYFRLWIMNFEGPIFTKIDNAAAFSESFFAKVVTYNYLYFINFLLLIWPQWLCFDWSMGCIPLIEELTDFRLLFVIVFWSFLVTSLFSVNVMKSKEMLLAWSWLILPFLPASNIFLKVGFVVAERALFLPSCGYCLLVTFGYEKLRTRGIVSRRMLFVLHAVLFAKTIMRNCEWLNEDRLFTSALQVCPLNAKVHYNVAKVAADKSNRNLAVIEYKRALELNPAYEQAMNNLANILREDKHFAEAERLLRRAVEVRPNFAAAWMNLGIVLASLNNSREAEECYLKAIHHRSKYPDCFYNLGNLYLDAKENVKALKAWEMAVHYRPTHTAAWSNTLVLLDSLQQYDQVLDRGRSALMHNPKSPALHFCIANTLGKLQQFEAAEKHFLEALNFSPYNALYHSNLGVLYHRWGNVEKARDMYKKALHIDPRLKTAENNLRKLLNGQKSMKQS